MPKFSILLDECLPVKLKFRFQEYSPDFHVSTVRDQKWSGLKNGKLLTKAQDSFDVLVTVDKHMSFQQQLSSFSIAVIALRVHSNRYKDLVRYVEPAAKLVQDAEKGEIQYVEVDS